MAASPITVPGPKIAAAPARQGLGERIEALHQRDRLGEGIDAGLGRLPVDLGVMLEEGVETVGHRASQPPSTGRIAPWM